MVTVITVVGSMSVIGDEGGSLIGAVTVITVVGSISLIGDEGGSLIGAVTVITLVGLVSVTGVKEDEGSTLLAVVTVKILFGEPVSTAVVAVVIVLGVPGWCEGMYILSGLPVVAAVGAVVGD